jgi:hypothetical protein
MATIINSSFASPLAHVNLTVPLASPDAGLLGAVFNGVSAWTVALTFFLALVAYDQCASLQIA